MPRKVNTETELQKVETQVQAFESSIKDLTLDSMSSAPKEQVEAQTKMSTREINKDDGIYLKPIRKISSREPFNERFRAEYEEKKEYTKVICENREVIGEDIQLWSKPFAGVPCEEWKVPVNKPVWMPIYLAEQIKRKYYHRLKTDDKIVTNDTGTTQQYGAVVVDTTVQRLDCIPASRGKQLFVGARGF